MHHCPSGAIAGQTQATDFALNHIYYPIVFRECRATLSSGANLVISPYLKGRRNLPLKYRCFRSMI
jgi:hypothetical protein